LAIRRKVYTQVIGRGLRIGYRRCKTEGTWSVIKADGRGGSWIDKIEGVVTDHPKVPISHVPEGKRCTA
jgi:hypothetical protein